VTEKDARVTSAASVARSLEVRAMAKQVVDGATLGCDKGTSPATLSVVPPPAVDSEGKSLATVKHYLPMTNIAPFGMCTTMANPTVAAATAAAQGVLTPQPCVPSTTSPWSPGAAHVTAGAAGDKALTDDSTCACSWTGTITVKSAGSSVELD
jgi:hypothetical protein